MKNFILAIAVSAITFSTANAQVCVGPECQLDQIEMSLQAAVMNAQAEGPSSNNAVRIFAGNGCGSGSVVGDGLIMTNAHVVGTRVGRQVTVRPKATGREIVGTVIMAAYSDRTLADWAVVKCDPEGLQGITPVPMSTKPPSGRHYTTGSPRCVWPLTSTAVITADIADNSPLWRWRPNAIGGQSGSGVWGVDDNIQDGLLTWSWGGLGAGQQTSVIYKQAREKSTAGPDRIPGLIELIEPSPIQQGDEVIVEVGFFKQTNVSDLPIWEGQQAEPEPDKPTDPDALDLTMAEAKVIDAMRAADPDDYDALVQIVLGILSLSSE